MSDLDLRQILHAQAESALEGVDAAALVRAGLAAHRRRRYRGAIVGAGVAVAVGAAAAIPLTLLPREHAEPAKPPTYASPMQWPIRGALAGDKAAIRSLTAATLGVSRVLYIGAGSNDAYTYGVVLTGSVKDHDLQVVGCHTRDLHTPPVRPTQPAWICVMPSTAGGNVILPSAVLLLAGDSGGMLQVALAPPGGHVTGVSDMYATQLDDDGQPSQPVGTSPAPVTETVDGVVVRQIPGPTSSMTAYAVRVAVQPPAGALVLASVTYALPLDSSGAHAEVYWGWGPDQRLRGLPPLLDNPEQNPGLRVWARLHGLSTPMPGYYSPIWGGTLADGSRAILVQPLTPARISTAFMVNPPTTGTDDTFLVRDVDNPANPATVHQISAYLPLSNGHCELVVVAAPGTTRITYRPTPTSSFADLPQPQHDGVGRIVLATCDGHQDAAIQVYAGTHRTYEGPVDSTRPNAGPRH
jgi:hypothetical protein